MSYMTRRTIYLPDPLAERCDRVAKANGLNASEFHQRAATKFADELEDSDAKISAQINAVIDEIGTQPPMNLGIATALIESGGWEW